ncbi:type IV pilus assembly protein PilA [Cytobacillus oceanisediminis]|jgi:type IV pilus assembly protein PilA|uniref:Type IV pilus assembly protein PilA n=1 Tax=Cytobacillus oceanisediminis TaxID=665099 RepID=A0A2V2ZNE3_9BACI|nr:type IV pilus assembly protein PilA [Cytobacillus oceanisediminis]
MMFKRIRNYFKNQKGLTLVELLAVIVILGILAAIAVPSIGGIIDNSKKDAHIANAKQIVSAAKLANAGGLDLESVNGGTGDPDQGYNLDDLINNGYLEEFIDPDTKSAYTSGYVVLVSDSTTGNYSYEVSLVGNDRSIGQSVPIDVNDIDRDDVVITTVPEPTSGG